MQRKRPQSNSAAGAVAAMLNAAKGVLQPPAHVELTPSAMQFWPGIVGARARDEWTDVDLVVAAQLATCQADMADEDALLRAEGKVIENQRGTPVMNPRTTVMEQLARREMALMRALRIGGRAGGADPRVGLDRAKVERQARSVREELEDEDLLAR
jgi:glutamine synthetase